MIQSKPKIRIHILIILSVLLVSAQQAGNMDENQKDTTLVYLFEIKENIAPQHGDIPTRAFEEADEMNADLVLIHMNTYGGMLSDAAHSIRTKILNSDIPVWVFIDNNAASAGALISIACDSIYSASRGKHRGSHGR